jgi:hypothetical protein
VAVRGPEERVRGMTFVLRQFALPPTRGPEQPHVNPRRPRAELRHKDDGAPTRSTVWSVSMRGSTRKVAVLEAAATKAVELPDDEGGDDDDDDDQMKGRFQEDVDDIVPSAGPKVKKRPGGQAGRVVRRCRFAHFERRRRSRPLGLDPDAVRRAELLEPKGRRTRQSQHTGQEGPSALVLAMAP